MALSLALTVQAGEVGILVQDLALMREVLVDLLGIPDHPLLIRVLRQILKVLLLLLRDDVVHGVPRVLTLAGELRLGIVGALARQALLVVVSVICLRGLHILQASLGPARESVAGVPVDVHLRLRAILVEVVLRFVGLAHELI